MLPAQNALIRRDKCMGLSVNRAFFTNPTTLAAPASPSGIELSNRFAKVEKIGDSSCYQEIANKYPGMDSVSRGIAMIFCENQQEALDVGDEVALSNQGIHGIGDALKQNTKLRNFTISLYCEPPDDDCLDTFANDFSSALKVNRGLRTFNLDVDNPFFQSYAGNLVFLSSLPCFNLDSLQFRGSVTSTAASTLFPEIFSQKFPLTYFSMFWIPNHDISSLSNGIGKNSCLKILDLSLNLFDNASIVTTLFGGIGASRIERLYLPVVLNSDNFTNEQKSAVLRGVQSNPCFLECVTDPQSPFPKDLAAAIANITKNRTPCPLDPACSAPVSCVVPTLAPVPSSYVEGIATTFSIASVAILALVIFGMCISKRQCEASSV
jgi:hypothetical protein